MPNLAKNDYTDRINRTIDYITENMSQTLGLEILASVAGFSPYHFHRIFRSATTETLNEFVKRVRLERAVYLISHNRDMSISDVADACGFSSSSDFSRNFRATYGVSPRKFDSEAFRKKRRQSLGAVLDQPKNDQDSVRPSAGDNPDGFKPMVTRIEARRVAYVRVNRPYEGNGVELGAETLVKWARERNLAHGQWLGYQWDDPEIVPLEKCRYDIGVEIPSGTEIDGDVSYTTFDPMTVAEIPIAGTIDLEIRALNWIYSTWLPSSGYVPDHQPCFEAWDGLPFAHGNEHFELRLQLPVVRTMNRDARRK